MYFGTYRLRKTWLDKCVKGLVSVERSINHMINVPLFKTELLPQLPQLFMNLKQLSWKRSLLVI